MKTFEEKIEKLNAVVDEIIGEQEDRAMLMVIKHDEKIIFKLNGDALDLATCLYFAMKDTPILEEIFGAAIEIYNKQKS